MSFSKQVRTEFGRVHDCRRRLKVPDAEKILRWVESESKQACKHAKEEIDKLAASCNRVLRLHIPAIHSFSQSLSQSATEPFNHPGSQSLRCRQVVTSNGRKAK